MAEKKRTATTHVTDHADNAAANATDCKPADDGMQHFNLNPRETTSIVNGNNVIVFDKGITSVAVAGSNKA